MKSFYTGIVGFFILYFFQFPWWRRWEQGGPGGSGKDRQGAGVPYAVSHWVRPSERLGYVRNAWLRDSRLLGCDVVWSLENQELRPSTSFLALVGASSLPFFCLYQMNLKQNLLTSQPATMRSLLQKNLRLPDYQGWSPGRPCPASARSAQAESGSRGKFRISFVTESTV